MKTSSNATRRAFTLIELSVAIMMSILTGSMVIALFNQQMFFLKLVKQQNFLTEEAPIISTYVSKLVGKADRFRLHDTVEDALGNVEPRGAGDGLLPVVVLNFRQPDGSMRASMLSFEDRGAGSKLYYYVVPTSGVVAAPQWAVTDKPKNVRFTVEQGVLRMTLTGPADEQIIYSGTMQQ